MLISFGAKNFCCFKEWLEVDLSLNEQVPADVPKKNGTSYVTAFYGANASGKTNALKALSFAAHFTCHSFDAKPEDEIAVDTFFNNKEDTEFFVDFRTGEVEYSYELTLSRRQVIEEKLSRKEKRDTVVFWRSRQEIKHNSLFSNKEIKLRENASFISTAHQYSVKEISGIYSFFSAIYTNVKYEGLKQEILNVRDLSGYYKKDQELLLFVQKLISKFDTGISKIEIESVKDEQKKDIVFPIFHHSLNESAAPLSHANQSSGTKRLFHNLIFYYMALKTGGVLALDEFDLNLHPDILPHLLSLFESAETNPRDAQLLFSTHNVSFMDKMGKYRTYLFEKRNGESFCVRVDEIPDAFIRNDRSLSRLYGSGKIGGVPKL